MRTQEWATQVSHLIGIDLSTVQAAPTVHLSFMILLFEIVCWPQAAKNCRLGFAKAASLKREAEAPPPEPLEPATILTVEAEPVRKALPAPKGVKDPKAITIRANPTAQWRALLDKIDFPPAGARHKGPRRKKDQKEHVALRFVAWLGAYHEEGDFSEAALDDLYAEFCAMDHREQWSPRTMRGELEGLGRRVAHRWKGTAGQTWTVVAPPIDKLTTVLERKGVIAPTGVAGVISPGVLKFPAAKASG
jgi:hypothetical protein